MTKVGRLVHIKISEDDEACLAAVIVKDLKQLNGSVILNVFDDVGGVSHSMICPLDSTGQLVGSWHYIDFHR